MAFNLEKNFNLNWSASEESESERDDAAAALVMMKEYEEKSQKRRIWRKEWVEKREVEFENRCPSNKANHA